MYWSQIRNDRVRGNCRSKTPPPLQSCQLPAAAAMEACLEQYFPTGSPLNPDMNALLDVSCAKMVVSKALGAGIVAGSMLVKVL